MVLSLAEPTDRGIVYDELKIQVTEDRVAHGHRVSSKTITVSVGDCALAAPKSSRPGYPNTFRLDTVAPDVGSGLKKFIIALPTEVTPSADQSRTCLHVSIALIGHGSMCAQGELEAWMEKLKPFESAVSKAAREAIAAQAIKAAELAEAQAAAKAKRAEEKAAANAKKAEEHLAIEEGGSGGKISIENVLADAAPQMEDMEEGTFESEER